MDQLPEGAVTGAHGGGNAKRGALRGGALDEDALASSRRVLAGGRHGGGVGLQQYFTAAPVAEFIADVLNPDRTLPAFDPTAGDGALLAPHPRRFGVEVDGDHAHSGAYHAIHGDLQRAYLLLRVAGRTFPRIVSNPPFGLTWRLPGADGGKDMNSTLACTLMSLELLDFGGLAAVICGRDRLHRELLSNPTVAKATWAIVHLDGDAFPGVTLPTSVLFLCSQPREGIHIAPVEITCAVEDLGGAVDALHAAAATHVSYISSSRRTYDLHEEFKEVAAVYAERYPRSGRARYDITVRGQRLRITLGALARILSDYGSEARLLERLNGQPPSYLALNSRDWRAVTALLAEGLITADPAAVAVVDREIERAQVLLRPMYPVPPQMRLGFLDDLDQITCTASDPDRGFTAGDTYPLRVESQVQTEQQEKLVTRRDGDAEVRQFEVERRILRVTVAGERFDESPADIAYLGEHFEIPDPGDLGRDHPAELERIKAVLRDIEAQWGPADAARSNPTGWRLKAYQLEDLARAILKQRAVLAHDMGLGKTCCQLLFAEACARLGYATPVALFITPQDLHDQWQREARKFLGRDLQVIRTPGQAARVRHHVRSGGHGMWLTHYEALSLIGVVDERLPPAVVLRDGQTRAAWHAATRRARLEHTAEWRAKADAEYEAACAKWQAQRDAAAQDDAGRWSFYETVRPRRAEPAAFPSTLTTDMVCPSCRQINDGRRRNDAERRTDRWDGLNCGRCGYTHRARRVPSVASILADVFTRGVICVDELSMIRGDTSRRSLAVRGLRAACRLGASGTPIANYISDAFYGLGFVLGFGTPRFPYGYRDGKRKFEDDFAVISFQLGREEDGEGHVRKQRKVLPEVTNLSMLWRLLSMSMIRRRLQDTGEALVAKTTHIVPVPAGRAQRAMHLAWLDRFAAFFVERNPGHRLVAAGQVKRFEAVLGLLAKLQYAATLPAADPDLDWLGVPGVSNVTPALLKALEIIERHVDAGDRVLVGSCLIETGPLIARMLRERGVRAAHITERRSGKTVTKNPRVRAREVTAFVNGDVDVLCAGVQAVKLGHNLDTASVVVLFGLPWSHEAKSQFLARVHRLTSVRPVSVYVVLTRGLMDTQKLALLDDKEAASDVALDGRLIDQNREEQDWAKALEEMRAAGVPITGDEADEAALYDQWLESLPATADRNALPPITLVRQQEHRTKPAPWVLDVGDGEQTTLFAA